MLIAIDGTGPARDADYERVMRTSFVRRLVRDYRGRGSMYFRGPGKGWYSHVLPGADSADQIFGISVEERAREAMIAARVAIRANDVVHLAGYSRGGAIAIRVAQLMLAEFPDARVPVMALFDAVDRSEATSVDRIPRNVVKAFHAVRDPLARSRTYFSNCGLEAEPPCELETLSFVTTHGGMGGVPFPDAVEEAFTVRVGPNTELHQSDLVQRWMWAHLRKEGIVR